MDIVRTSTWRALSGWACFALGLALCLLLVHGIFERLQIGHRFPLALDHYYFVDVWKSSYAEARQSSTAETIAITGCSMIMPPSQPVEDGVHAIPERLVQELRGLAPEREIQIVPLRWGGFGQLQNYFFADEIAETGVQRVVVALNLRSIARAWTGTWTKPELAGFIAPRRVPDALALPLHVVGLTADRLLLYVFLKNSLGYRAWRNTTKEQSRAIQALEALSERADRWMNLEAHRSFVRQTLRELKRQEGERLSLEGVMHEYGPVLAGVDTTHPVLRVLGATLRNWRDAGIEVLVVVLPANIEHWRSLGLLGDGQGVARSIAAIEEAVRTNGGSFLDLHDLLGKEGFRDPAGHLTYTGGVDGHERVISRSSGSRSSSTTASFALWCGAFGQSFHLRLRSSSRSVCSRSSSTRRSL
jgi:hypothetical protein